MSILKPLYWLSLIFHIDFTIILLVYKALHGLASDYLSEMLLVMNQEGSKDPLVLLF